jgi:transcriptional regulator with XRE-family HTH domain
MTINVKQLAKDRQVTRPELAKELKVSLRTLDHWQKGSREISAKNFIKLLIFSKEDLVDFLTKYSSYCKN